MIYHTTGQDEHATYTLHDLDKEVRLTVKGLKPHLDEFDVIAVTGLSGILPAVPAALRLKVPLAILRKPEDNTHQYGGQRFSKDGSRWVNGRVIEGSRVLWLDDFRVSGDTARRICAAVTELGGKVVASYLTQDHLYAEMP